MGSRASPITFTVKIEDRGPVGMLTGFGAGSERRWRANELSGRGTENPGNFRNWTRQGCRNQNRRGCNRLGVESDMGCRANRAGVVGCGRVLGMRVGCLYRTHHAHQGNAEHTHSSDEYTPICRYPQHAITAFLMDLGAWPLDDCTLRCSSTEIRRTKNEPPRALRNMAFRLLAATDRLAVKTNYSNKMLSHKN
jgi:hypothetical protein